MTICIGSNLFFVSEKKMTELKEKMYTAAENFD